VDDKYIYLYKYLPFNEGSLKVLTEGTIKFSCPLDFNDPFDCKPAYDENSLREIDKNKSPLIHEIGRKMKLSPAKRLLNKKKIANNIKRYIESGKSRQHLLSEAGVLCLSSNPASILMWSHYADFHKGFVVGFKIPLSGPEHEAKKPGENFIALQVKYSDTRPEYGYGTDAPFDAMEKMLFTKSNHWQYESEYRVWDNRRGSGIHTYNRDKLLYSVIAGAKMQQTHKETLASVIQQLNDAPTLHNIKLYNAKEHPKKYKILIPGYPLEIPKS